MSAAEIFALAISAILAENFVFTKLFGACPFFGISDRPRRVLSLGAAISAVMVVSSAVLWAVNRLVLIPLGVEYLRVAAFVLICAALVPCVGAVLKKAVPALYEALGANLPLIAVNSAVMGAALTAAQAGYGIVASVVYAAAGGLGFTMALFLFASVRERLEFSECPKCFEGLPIALVTAALIAMAFSGFHGMKLF